jgi:hypothetical protein
MSKPASTAPQSLPSHYAIALHWRSQPLERERLPYVVDIGEPSCFACGWYPSDWDREKDLRKRWSQAGLERAHIIARSMGGSNREPGNFVLLCKECHPKAPMTGTPTICTTGSERGSGAADSAGLLVTSRKPCGLSALRWKPWSKWIA